MGRDDSVNTTPSSLSLVIQQPFPNQVIPPGKDFVVTGLATGIGGAEPHLIDSVTVQVGGETPVSASLGPPPQPEPLTVAYSASVRITGPVTITVTAADDIGAEITRAVSVTTAYSTPCAGGVPWNNYPRTKTVTPYRTCTPDGLMDVIAIVREAEAAGKHVHALGSGWSFSDCAVTTDYLIDTTHLAQQIQAVQQALLPGKSEPVFHVEAGMTIEGLYTALAQSTASDQRGLALKTMGGSSGQTIAGAISTGTHGGDLFMPPLADTVLALHLVGVGGTEYWIEPSPGITDPALLQKYVVPGIDPQNIIYDNATFNACLVSLGCMGVIYAVVLSVRGAYDLIETTRGTTWQALLPTMPALLRDESNRFLQIAVSPYPDETNNNPCLVTTRTEAAPTGPAVRPSGAVLQAIGLLIAGLDPLVGVTIGVPLILGDHGLTDDQKLIKIVQTIMSQAPDQRHVLAENYGNFMLALWPAVTIRGLSSSVMDTTYGQPAESSKPSYSAEVFFPSIDSTGQMPFVAFVNAAIAAINAATGTFYTGYVSLRFTGATRATLGMQQWSQTCAIEFSCLPGVQGELALYTQILNL
jgi:FAD/FMN-containing dehydrogenase